MNRPSTGLSWVVIAIACAGIVLGHIVLDERRDPDADEATRLALLKLQARALVAAAQWEPGAVREQLSALDVEATTPRLARALAAVHAEVGGTFPSRAGLDLLDRHRGRLADDDEIALHGAVETALRNGPGVLSDEQRARIVDDLGWFGELLLVADASPDDPQRRAVLAPGRRVLLTFTLALAAACAGVLAGVVLWIVVGVLRRDGRMRTRFVPPRDHGPWYLQAFAVYVGLFFVLQVVPGLLADRLGPVLAGGLAFGGLVGTSVLGALWPRIQGVPGRIAARDLGFHRGTGVLREVASGIVGYVAILPIAAVGFLVTLGLMAVWTALGGGQDSGPVHHPIVPLVAEGGTAVRILLLGLAAGFAPFFEELLFRGALYGDLRNRFGPVASAGLMALVFAAIHPQGLLTVPALGALAFGFAVLREWRGSLIAPMVAHAVHNGALVGLMWIAFR